MRTGATPLIQSSEEFSVNNKGSENIQAYTYTETYRSCSFFTAVAKFQSKKVPRSVSLVRPIE
jgi:hypothetical protein